MRQQSTEIHTRSTGAEGAADKSEIRLTSRQWAAIFCGVPIVLCVVIFIILGLTPNIGWAKAGQGALMIVGGLVGVTIASLIVFALPALTLRYVHRRLRASCTEESSTPSRKTRAAIVYVTVVSVFASALSVGIGLAGSALASEGILRGTSSSFTMGGAIFLFGYGFLFSGIMGALSAIPMAHVRRTVMGTISIGTALAAGVVAPLFILGTANTICGIAGGIAAAFVILIFQGRSPRAPQE